jgi:hypothetical protein
MGICNGKLTRAVVPCVAACGGLHMSVVHPICRAHAANARRRRVSRRAPALRPHRTDQISTRVQRAHSRQGKYSDLFGPPQIVVGRLAPAGLCSSAARRGLAGQEGGGREEGGRRGEEGSLPPRTGWMRSPSHCERHVLMSNPALVDFRLLFTLYTCTVCSPRTPPLPLPSAHAYTRTEPAHSR